MRAGGAGRQGVYLYCICPRGVRYSPALTGIENSRVHTLTYNDLALVASNAPMKNYEPSQENVRAHKGVALSVLERNSVLPVAFGMVFKNRKILLGTARRLYPVLKKSLSSVRDKVELGVKVVLPKGARPPKSMQGFEAGFMKRLGAVAAASKKGRLFSDRLALNASFLVAKGRVEQFSGEVRTLEKEHPKLKVQYSGPWPAYNFVDIKIMSKGRGGG